MRRRDFVAALSALVLPAVGWAESPPVHIVKLLNFSCASCRAAENIDAPLRDAVTKAGGLFVYAPIPRETSDAREIVYYAVRDLYPKQESKLRDSLYRGSQDLNFPLSDVAQTIDWLRQDLGEEIDWVRVAQRSNDPEPSRSIDRAITLAVRGGVSAVPAYLLVQDGQVLATFDLKSNGGDFSTLRAAVLEGLRTAQPK